MQVNKKLELQELAIAIAAKNLNPTALNPDFLKYTGIIPTDWELARQPVYTNQAAQLAFQSGVSIIAQPNRIVFVEAIANKNVQELQVAEIASNYTQKLSQVEYQVVGINPVGYVSFDSDAESHQYFSQTLLSPGSWQDFGETPVRAGIDLSYTLSRSQLNLKINQAILKFPEKSVSAILFAGHFNYQIAGDNPEEQRSDLQQVIQNWQTDLETYQKLIEEKFLSSVTRIPNIFPVMSSAF
jgi:hypothetical protein